MSQQKTILETDMPNKLNWYTAQINGDMQLEFESESIESAFAYAIAEYRKQYPRKEEPGYDIKARIWCSYGDGV